MKVRVYTGTHITGTGKHGSNLTSKAMLLFGVRKKVIALECPQSVEK